VKAVEGSLSNVIVCLDIEQVAFILLRSNDSFIYQLTFLIHGT